MVWAVYMVWYFMCYVDEFPSRENGRVLKRPFSCIHERWVGWVLRMKLGMLDRISTRHTDGVGGF